MADVYGVVEEGFVKKPTAQILTDIEESFKEAFGDSINLDASSPEGQMVQVFTPLINDLWELAQQAYNAYAPSMASGRTLDHLVKLNGLERSDISYSTASLTINGSNGTIIPAGSSVRSVADEATGQSYVFNTDYETIIGSSISGLAYVNSTCSTEGVISIGPGLITSILTPIAGWDTVTNENSAVIGQGLEEDPQLRKRRELSIGIQATNTVDAIQARIVAIDTVQKVLCLQNDTSALDINGLEPYSIKAVVQGTRSAEEVQLVGEEIFAVKPPGVDMNGGNGAAFTEEVIVLDSQGFPHEITYAIPEDIPIYIRVETTVDDLTSPTDIGDIITEAVIEYFADTLTGYTIGDDVYYSRIYVPLNGVADHVVSNLTIGTDLTTMGKDDISISIDQLARIFSGDDGVGDPYVYVDVQRD